uniref:DNA protecting protein DprA n=1 Tax=Candidatus Kentrum eta TaxID=2126337 RepID=A0A450UGI1_9GAMM|nr:MAG: DNA protecting protein DprA [Candidatus Kentron sp. H]VFJ92701.1 MAG: DNA protecting protein DprA [Candidatus Kentron sp. H]VFJ99512.1 MAG: DNA protecting protein DprA [Candidatus Kentron sp. H]
MGGAGLRALLARYPDPQFFFQAAPDQLAGMGLHQETRQYLRARDWSHIAADLAWLEQPDHHLLTLADPGYPARLLQIPDPPPVLFVRGDPDALGHPQIAIVGSRNPTPTGRETAFAFAKALAGMGFVITSGLAIGIDGAAHRGAMAAGGRTIAVVGTGLDRVYPARHRALGLEIVQNSACVSEFPVGAPPMPGNFPRRNRIISGLGLGTLVVEATTRSGSLITARLAAEQGREVFAIPGSIHNPLARGCHMLLRQGAKLVESADDILEEIGPQDAIHPPSETDAAEPHADPTPGPALDAEYTRLLDSLGFEPTPVDVLCERTGLAVQVVSSMLLTLELHGHVSSAPGRGYARRKTP